MNLTTRYLQSVADRPEIEIATLVNTIMLDAVQFGASDVHIEPWESTIVVRVRLNGVLSELVHLPLELMEKIAGRIKIMANLVSYQTDVPQEGHVSSHPDHGNVELRISSFPTVRGEKIVIRIFDPSNRSFDLAALGFEEETLQALIKLLARPSGLILLTGPTGSGKTTALYAALSHLVHRSGPTISIATVEDPVEFHLPMVSQTQVNLARELTYARALRSLMRQDPQVIMVGEIRDAETAGIAVQAGMTGHLVLSTIHSGSTAGIFARLINMEIEPFLLSSSISAVMGLRLVRRNCPFCLVAYDPTPAQLALAALAPGTQFRRGAGCAHCLGTGFTGRSAITEIMVLNEAMRDAILRKMPTRALQDFAIEQGMATLWHSGLRRSFAGETTLEEIMRVVAVDHG